MFFSVLSDVGAPREIYLDEEDTVWVRRVFIGKECADILWAEPWFVVVCGIVRIYFGFGDNITTPLAAYASRQVMYVLCFTHEKVERSRWVC